jgi:predicted amidohydrolase YtcJ
MFLNTRLGVVVVFLFFSSCVATQQADRIVYNGVIYTVDSSFSVQSAMAIRNGRILETGTSKHIRRKYRSDSLLDARGRAIFPGFIDAHCHFTGFATDQWTCDLTGTHSFEEVVQRLSAYSKQAPAFWLFGRGWDQNDWPNKAFPDRAVLDSLFPDRPVYLKRIDGHAALANRKALELAGIFSGTDPHIVPQVSGGRFERINGRLTGVLIDNAMDGVERVIPAISDSLARQYIRSFQYRCFSYGLTGVHDCGISEKTLLLLQQEEQSGNLKMGVVVYLSDDSSYYDRWMASGPKVGERVRVAGFKLYADGALGSRGACLLHDYHDQPGWKGFLLKDIGYFEATARKLAASSLQMCTHAIGDSGNREIVRVYASALSGKNDRRWRIEHAQVVDRQDIHQFGQAGIIPSVQPTHATSDMYWAEGRLGARRVQSAYAYKSLLAENGWLPLGTDFPVEEINPINTFYAAVFRKDKKGYPAGGFQMEEALTREQAIRGMTIWAAKAAFEEHEKGSLEPGKWADYIILDTDLMQAAEKEILRTKVTQTVVRGRREF